jgi:hypothetical protein
MGFAWGSATTFMHHAADRKNSLVDGLIVIDTWDTGVIRLEWNWHPILWLLDAYFVDVYAAVESGCH